MFTDRETLKAEVRKLPRYTSRNGVLFMDKYGELVETGAVLSLLNALPEVLSPSPSPSLSLEEIRRTISEEAASFAGSESWPTRLRERFAERCVARLQQHTKTTQQVDPMMQQFESASKGYDTARVSAKLRNFFESDDHDANKEEKGDA